MALTYDNQGNLVDTGETIPGSTPFDQGAINNTNLGWLDMIRRWLPSGEDITKAYGDNSATSILGGTSFYGGQNYNPNLSDYQGEGLEEDLYGETLEENPDYMDRPGMFGKPRGFGSGQGWFSRIGQGGEGFMGKFGTGEGWLARGADRRAARRGGGGISPQPQGGQPSDDITAAPGDTGGGNNAWTWQNLMPEIDEAYGYQGVGRQIRPTQSPI